MVDSPNQRLVSYTVCADHFSKKLYTLIYELSSIVFKSLEFHPLLFCFVRAADPLFLRLPCLASSLLRLLCVSSSFLCCLTSSVPVSPTLLPLSRVHPVASWRLDRVEFQSKQLI